MNVKIEINLLRFERLDIFEKDCKNMYEASPFATVDEELVKFRCRCPFKVCMPNLGRTGDQTEVNKGHRVVKVLVNYWKNSGCSVTTDNVFTDITLVEDLLACKVTVVCTLRKNRKVLLMCLVNVKERSIIHPTFCSPKN